MTTSRKLVYFLFLASFINSDGFVFKNVDILKYGEHFGENKEVATEVENNRSYFDPDANKNLTELILSQGYPCEKYTVLTKDGFVLDLHRIPHGHHSLGKSTPRFSNISKPVVYLQHALLSSACDWVMNYAKDSLGFILADAGYDVWMGNSRGNTYSCKHVNYSPKDERFWDWSFDEMAEYDITAFLDFVIMETGAPAVHYIGHSQGTTMAFALFSERPDYRQKIKLFVALAPVTHITHAQSPITYFARFSDRALYAIYGKKDILPNSKFMKFLVDLLCTNVHSRWACYNLMFLLVGYDISNLNQTRLQVYLSHSPAGASMKDIVHFAQMYRLKKFMKYDFGSPAENMNHYNQTYPPEYNVSNIDVPIVAFTGTKDLLADQEDAAALFTSLPNLISKYEIEGWNHLDFVWGINAAKQCYKTILEWLNKF